MQIFQIPTNVKTWKLPGAMDPAHPNHGGFTDTPNLNGGFTSAGASLVNELRARFYTSTCPLVVTKTRGQRVARVIKGALAL